MKCPVCGNGNAEIRETRQCPKNNGIPVCVVNCCNNCSDYDVKRPPICRWYVNNRSEENINPEVVRLGKEIEETKRRINYYYNKGYKNTALRQEIKLKTLIARKKGLSAGDTDIKSIEV